MQGREHIKGLFMRGTSLVGLCQSSDVDVKTIRSKLTDPPRGNVFIYLQNPKR